jgi:hypothetical protein
MENNDDSIIEDLEKRLMELYHKKEEPKIKSNDEQKKRLVFDVENIDVDTSSSTSSTSITSSSAVVVQPVQQLSSPNIFVFFYFFIPFVISGLLYSIKPKQIMKNSKIDRYRFARLVFMVTVTLWFSLAVYQYYHHRK